MPIRFGGREKGEGRTLAVFLSNVLAALVFAGIVSSPPPRESAAPLFASEGLSVAESAATPDASALPPGLDGQPRRSEVLERLGVKAWHASGWRGRGLTIAVLDSGFNGYRAHLGSALPRDVKIRSFRFDGNLEAKDSQHGILCAEVIHALAPEAQLLLANWEPEHPEQFLHAVRWASEEGARIISCSVIMPTWSDCEGHGRVHEELAEILGASEHGRNVLFFASAGNTAQRHWSGAFEDGGAGYHIWKRTGGVAHTDNAIAPWGSERVSVELCCPSSAGYEVLVSDATRGQIVGRMRSVEARGCGHAVVGFIPEPGHDYRVRVHGLRNVSGRFHLVVLGGGLRYASSPGSIPFPGDGPEVFAVGAVDPAGRRLSYSSCGLKRGTTKPNFVASVPFPSGWRVRPFAGTSAAAPQGAALAALFWSRHPDWNAQRVGNALKDAARPCAPECAAWETGHGTIRLPAASVAISEPAAVLP
jgi:subtilisin family serine protease